MASRLQSEATNRLMEETGIVGGKAPRNIYSGSRPKVKAFVGRLPSGRTGIEFYTDVPPDDHLPPGRAEWSRGRPGVIDLEPMTDDGADVVGIEVVLTKRVDR